MATARARREGGRPLNAAERRWLLGQMLQRGTRRAVAAEVAAEAEEASSVIVRPAPAAPQSPPAPTTGAAEEQGAFAGPSLRGGLPASPALAERAPPDAPMAPEPGPMIPQYSTRDAHRAAPAVDLRRYRAVFACSMQARDAPTEQSPSG
jgi:hypothetical protein